MMGERRVQQDALFYEFSLERHVPAEHLLRSIDRFVELDGVRCELAPFYSEVGRPSIDPELMIRMLIVGYCFGIRLERRLCEEVHLNLAYRWFCRLGLDGAVPDHSTFSKNRHGRFRDSDLLRKVFETTVRRCHAVREYLEVVDDAAFGAATPVVPKFVSPADPASRWTGAHGGLAFFFAYCTNYLIDLKRAVIVDVEATTAVRQAEVTAQQRMIDTALMHPARRGSRPNRRRRRPPAAQATGQSAPAYDPTNPSAATALSRATTSPMTTNATATSARPGRISGSAKKSIECRVLSSMSTG